MLRKGARPVPVASSQSVAPGNRWSITKVPTGFLPTSTESPAWIYCKCDVKRQPGTLIDKNSKLSSSFALTMLQARISSWPSTSIPTSVNCPFSNWKEGSRVQVKLKSVSRSEEHTSELQSPDHLVCRLLLEKKK